MANEEHLNILQQGVDVWNQWRDRHAEVRPELSHAGLNSAKLAAINLYEADLRHANFSQADLKGANLINADIMYGELRFSDCTGADFTGANLAWASMNAANLSDADLCGTNLSSAILSHAKLAGADLAGAEVLDVTIANVDMSETKGLHRCRHRGPSTIDHRTLERSKNVPLSFWQGCGLSERLIDYLPALIIDALQFFSCFISYSTKDQEFADRLYADLQNNGVRCWFAPHDLPIGAKTWDGIDEAIRTRDKVLLILSEAAISSEWVEDEVTKAFAEERRRGELVLFPVRLDDSVMDAKEPWAGKLRDNRNIGDFVRWKDHDVYQATLKRLLRDLKIERQDSTQSSCLV